MKAPITRANGFEPQISMEDGLTETVQQLDQHSKKEVELV